jgi:hypothetical protein
MSNKTFVPVLDKIQVPTKNLKNEKQINHNQVVLSQNEFSGDRSTIQNNHVQLDQNFFFILS